MDENSWKTLLRSALSILDDFEARGLGRPRVQLGGGTVLMMRYRHRLSRDIDLFLHDAQWLAYLTPRLNDRVAAMTQDYSEQANSLKLVLADGDIDFIVSGAVIGDDPDGELDFLGAKTPLQSSAEILAKKLFFRAALLKPRDVFDLVAVHRADPEAASRAMAATASRRQEQASRLKALKRLPLETLTKDILCIAGYEDLLPDLISSGEALLGNGP